MGNIPGVPWGGCSTPPWQGKTKHQKGAESLGRRAFWASPVPQCAPTSHHAARDVPRGHSSHRGAPLRHLHVPSGVLHCLFTITGHIRCYVRCHRNRQILGHWYDTPKIVGQFRDGVPNAHTSAHCWPGKNVSADLEWVCFKCATPKNIEDLGLGLHMHIHLHTIRQKRCFCIQCWCSTTCW